MIWKTDDFDDSPSTVQSVIEHIQPKQCCINPHEGCAHTKEFKDFRQEEEDKKNHRKKKIAGLQSEQTV